LLLLGMWVWCAASFASKNVTNGGAVFSVVIALAATIIAAMTP